RAGDRGRARGADRLHERTGARDDVYYYSAGPPHSRKRLWIPTVTDDRPKPEQFLALIRQQQRGRLKLYLGFAPGVGKTYEMLQEGHRLRRQGVDVVTGVVETHGRAETAALLDGLEQVPRRNVEYRGVVLEEMDLDAVL